MEPDVGDLHPLVLLEYSCQSWTDGTSECGCGGVLEVMFN